MPGRLAQTQGSMGPRRVGCGDLDGFLNAYLTQLATGELKNNCIVYQYRSFGGDIAFRGFFGNDW